nr:hypothetical protein CDS [Bradyrhizobium sp.]
MTVTADGVTQRVVHRWPEDRAGKPIRPRKVAFAGAALARTLSFLTGVDRPEMGAYRRRTRAAAMRRYYFPIFHNGETQADEVWRAFWLC